MAIERNFKSEMATSKLLFILFMLFSYYYYFFAVTLENETLPTRINAETSGKNALGLYVHVCDSLSQLSFQFLKFNAKLELFAAEIKPQLLQNQLFHLVLLYFTNFTHRIEITMRSGAILCNVAMNVAIKVCIHQTTFELCWQDDV